MKYKNHMHLKIGFTPTVSMLICCINYKLSSQNKNYRMIKLLLDLIVDQNIAEWLALGALKPNVPSLSLAANYTQR